MIYLMMIDTEENKRKFEILYNQYKHLMLKVAYDVLKDTHLAEDAVHEAFIKLAKNMSKVGEVSARETKRYLITIIKNTSINIYNKRKSQLQHEIYVDELGESETPLTYMDSDIDRGFFEILNNLPIKYRDVFILKYANRLDNDEIAKLLNITEGNVRQRIARGKEMILKAKNSLEEKDYGERADNG